MQFLYHCNRFIIIYFTLSKRILFQLIQVFIGIFIIGIGSGYYLAANLGPGPRDGLMTGINKQTKSIDSFNKNTT